MIINKLFTLKLARKQIVLIETNRNDNRKKQAS